MVYQTENLTLKGIPAGLLAESVRLDEVFIPTQFRPDRPLVDYPLTEVELKASVRRSRQACTLSIFNVSFLLLSATGIALCLLMSVSKL